MAFIMQRSPFVFSLGGVRVCPWASFFFQLYSSLCFYVWDIFIYDNLIEVPSFKFIYIRLTYRSVSSCLLTVSTEMVVRELRSNMSYVLIISQKALKKGKK